MEAYDVTGESLLSELVTALVRQLRPEAIVRRAPERFEVGAVQIRSADGRRWIAVTHPEIRKAELVGIFRRGAVGVVELGASSDEFERALNALDGAHPGHVSLGVLKVIASGASVLGSPSLRLTPRQEEIARLAACGYSNKEIAEALNISANTVRTHLHSLSVKLEAESRMRMVAKARALGLLPSIEDERSAERNSA